MAIPRVRGRARTKEGKDLKKKYAKPMLELEAFQLNAAIAASCSSQGFQPISHGENSCGYEGAAGSWVYFNLNNCQIDLTGPETDGGDTYCYHGPTASYGMTFISS